MIPKKIINLKKGESMLCTILPKENFTNDVLSCILSPDQPESKLYIKKHQILVIEDSGKLEIAVSEYDRQQGVDRLLITRVK
jgi:hypothetical protein